ncbi:hypothetical protein [Aquitalea magnusonii]|uniref:hypothetical protein n=1 Tax=Aquitalea magnusonii TaxID=332411 RepID=UPI0011AE1940|nr:hypothetical protein [Aquitalea magnusonii]
MTKISFLHSGLPNNCISPNIISEQGLEEYPGMAGTGFIAKRANQLYYITARHCLTKNHKEEIGLLASKLNIPIRLTGRTEKPSDYLHLEEAISLKHNSEFLAGELIYLIVLPIKNPEKEKDRKHLLSRAIKLPPSGKWLDSFFEQPPIQEAIAMSKGQKFVIIGYPQNGTSSEIIYPEKPGESPNIITQAAQFHGYLAEDFHPDRFKLTGVTWEHDLNGFSGAPVLVTFKNENGPQYGLAGMLVTGGNGIAYFIKISIITQALV